MATFKFPWQYSFPPFFTLQPNLATREKQLDAWASFVLDYCQQNNIHRIDILQDSPLFHNSSIQRKLSHEGIRAVFALLEKRGHVEWHDKERKLCYIYWRTPEEWSKLLYDWAVQNGFLNTVHTLHALVNDDDNASEPFYKLDNDVLMKALTLLQKSGKAELIGTEGVKFF